MASIKLKHASGNSTILNSPAANPSADVTLKLPSTTGSAGQVLKVASANHSSTNAELEFAAAAGGKFASYALIADSKGNTTDGGTFTSGAWRTRDLNDEISDVDGIVSISNNQFTLAAGSYLIKWKCPAMKVDHHVTKLILITSSVSSFNEKAGSSSYAGTGSVVQNESFGLARVTLTGSGAFEIQHYGETTKSTDGFGQPANGYANESIYTTVEIYKEA